MYKKITTIEEVFGDGPKSKTENEEDVITVNVPLMISAREAFVKTLEAQRKELEDNIVDHD